MARTAELVRGVGIMRRCWWRRGHRLLFLLDEETGERSALRRNAMGGGRRVGGRYSTAELIAILETAPERTEPECAAAAGISGYDAADGGLCWRAGGDCLLCAERGVV